MGYLCSCVRASARQSRAQKERKKTKREGWEDGTPPRILASRRKILLPGSALRTAPLALHANRQRPPPGRRLAVLPTDAMPVHVSLVVPQGTTAGQQISFVHTDGRNVSLILPAGVVPGQMLHVNVPDDAAAPTPQAQQQQQQQAAGLSQPPPSKRQKSKKELAADDGMSLWPLSERRDPAVWRALSGLSATHGAWLGRGRDASQGTYDSLRLACAWRIQNPRRSARVEGGTRCMSDELDCLKRKRGVARHDDLEHGGGARGAGQAAAARRAERGAAAARHPTELAAHRTRQRPQRALQRHARGRRVWEWLEGMAHT